MTVHEYEPGPDGVDRVARTWTQSPWTPEDRALMLARDAYRATLCDGCGQPKNNAWHPDNEGWFEVNTIFVCNACTVMDREGNPQAPDRKYLMVTDTRDYDLDPLPPFPTGDRLTPEQLAEAMDGGT